MKYLVKKIFETEDILIDGVTITRDTSVVASYVVKQSTDAKHFPRGGGYIFIESDTKLNKPIVSVDVEGVLSLIEDPAQLVVSSITNIYNTMQSEVLAQMKLVFGTGNTDSALSYEATWKEMVVTPSDYSVAGLTARFAVAGLLVGDALDTDQKILDYANAKIVETKVYGVWRMQRIEQFRTDKASLLA